MDMRPLLPAIQAEALTEEETETAFKRIFLDLVGILPNEPWANAGPA